MNCVSIDIGPILRQVVINVSDNPEYAAFFNDETDSYFSVNGRTYVRGWSPRYVKAAVVHEWSVRENGVTVGTGADYYFCARVVRDKPARSVPFPS